jgi:hypothetical protein
MKECRKQLLSYAIFLCVAFAVLMNAAPQIAAGAPDFSSFYAAGQILRSGNGVHLYEYETQRMAQQQFSFRQGPLLFNHARFETMIYAPLSLLSFRGAYFTWWACNLLLLVVTLQLMAQTFPGIRALMHYWVLALAFFVPLQIALVQGQDSVLTLFLLAACLVLLAKGRSAAAGVVLALALYKPQLVLPIFLVLAVGESLRFVFGFAVGAIGLTGVSAVLVGWRGLESFPRFLAEFNSLPVSFSGADPRLMANARGFLLQSGFNASMALVAALSLVLLLLAMAAARASRSLSTRCAIAVTVASLASYHILTHDLTILVVPFLLAIHELALVDISKPRTIVLALATATMMLIPAMSMGPRLTFLGIAVFAVAFWMEMRGRTARFKPSEEGLLSPASNES